MKRFGGTRISTYLAVLSLILYIFTKEKCQADPEIQNDCTEDFAKEVPGEIIIEKHTFNGFQDTDLEEKLNALGIKEEFQDLETCFCMINF